MHRLEEGSYFPRDEATRIAGALAESGVYVNLHGGVRGWKITINGSTDLIALAKVLDTLQVIGKPLAADPETEPVNALYRPYGGDGWPDVLIYWGSKP